MKDIQDKIEEDQRHLNEITGEIMGLEDEQDLIQEQIDDLNAEIVNTMASIGMKEDEITAKEQEITHMEDEIHWKEHQITETEAEYEEAVLREENHRKNMAACARLIYERGESSYLDALLEGKGLADFLNQMDRIEKVCEYEQTVLTEYIETKDQVQALWNLLEEEKTALEDTKQLLVAERQQLQADRAELETQKAGLDTMLARKRQESANFEAEIQRARQEAAVAKKLLPETVRFTTHVTEIGGCTDPARFGEIVRAAAADGDSVGGIVECRAEGIPAGWGEPFFDSAESLTAHLLFAIPGVKGVEFGSGFAAAQMRGSEHNDPILDAAGRTATNHAGGIVGGLTNGNELVVRAAFKPTASIAREQTTYNRTTGRTKPLAIGGRHDACIALRGAAAVEAAVAIALADLRR